FGLGIHGEAGAQRVEIQTAQNTAIACLDYILDNSETRNYLPLETSSVVLLVNNLGGTTNLELNILIKNAIEYLETKSISVVRVISGALMTSLEMAGVSFTLLRIPPSDTIFISSLDAPVSSPGWPRNFASTGHTPILPETQSEDRSQVYDATTPQAESLVGVLVAACEALVRFEPEITRFDQIAGDGDCGKTMERGARAVLDRLGCDDGEWHAIGIPLDDLSATCAALASLLEDEMGGTSGALYCIFFDALAAELQSEPTLEQLAQALDAAVKAVQKYGGAKLGDRTLLDALIPAIAAFVEKINETGDYGKAIEAATDAAAKGSDNTKDMDAANFGRASYLIGGGL
ncbi:hypothetical protein HK096_000337, partial [Nowakowskiella sp. JEL0078]